MKWRCWVVFSSVQLSKNKPNIYQKYIQIYSNISKIYQDIPRCTQYQAAAGPPRPARPRYFVYLGISWYILVYLRIYLDIFLICFWYIFGIFLDNGTLEKTTQVEIGIIWRFQGHYFVAAWANRSCSMGCPKLDVSVEKERPLPLP